MKIPIFTLSALLVFSLSSSGGVVHVPGDFLTIQGGIDAASAGDVVLVADGIYTGSDNVNLDFRGKAITLRSLSGPHNCIIDCNNSGRGFNFHSGETSASVVEGFSIINGHFAGGGGVCLVGSSPIFRCCIIAACNTSSNGGAVYISGGFPTFINCTMYGNTAHSGGAIYSNCSNFTLNSCIVADNRAT